jgi:Cytochrome C'
MCSASLKSGVSPKVSRIMSASALTMKRIVCVVSTVATIALLAGARTQESATIKEVMDQLHKGGSAPLAKTALKAESPDWSKVQELTKEFVKYGALLEKNEPPRGDKADFEKLAKAYYTNAKALDDAAKAEDKDKAQSALNKIGASCKTCHTSHKGA